MLDAIKKTIMYDTNAVYFGYGIEKLMERAGVGIAKALFKKYGSGERIGFICGPGNNGGDGFAAARYLSVKCDPEVYLVPDVGGIKTAESRKNWRRLKCKKHDNITARDIPDNFDVVVECLFGTGIKGKLQPPYAGIIKKLNRMQGKKVTIDLPAPGFKAEYYISMMFPKTRGAEVVDIGYPKELAEKIGVGEVKVLKRVGENSHKGDNGQVLIIGGSKRYHGAPLLAAKTAAKIVDLVYFSSIAENNELIKSLKSKLDEFIAVPREEAMRAAGKCGAVLLGPGLLTGSGEAGLVNGLLKKYPKQKFVLDAGALRVVDKKLLKNNCILTPHKQEFNYLFGTKLTPASSLKDIRVCVRKYARKYGCVIALKGRVDVVCSAMDHKRSVYKPRMQSGTSSGVECKINETGNQGMTKGGTGDVLAGLIAGLAAINDPFLAARAGVFINGLAGDRLAKRRSYYYSASDLIREIPRTIKWCEDYIPVD